MTDSRPHPLYPLRGVPCVVCGLPAAGVVLTEHGTTATAHGRVDPKTGLTRICPHPPKGDTTHGNG
ncbi:hypothetical protein BJF85_16645 [Saccharomonospora sp. CUA-673]|uniref:hypothetical protein n=1 Tax=Saccharomonospora sp. CUA-673 TaxID=1904969 RepID=UPI000959DD32|nr:hypothetical protein [Saccharomonospora sp. CUA-673]OLT46473.1 hypothetical protein BJF85_16645 [Saccharomonospora sp. CUA-673]